MSRYAVIDTETTGIGTGVNGRVVQIGMVIYENGRAVDHLNTFVDPRPNGHGRIIIPPAAYRVNHIGYHQVKNAPTAKEIKPKVLDKLRGVKHIIGHNVSFDIRMLKANGIDVMRGREKIDTLSLGCEKHGRCKLEILAKKVKVKTSNKKMHSAYDDCLVCGQIFHKFKKGKKVHQLVKKK
jgi:DNA polymerase III epsilon subunit-like protein